MDTDAKQSDASRLAIARRHPWLGPRMPTIPSFPTKMNPIFLRFLILTQWTFWTLMPSSKTVVNGAVDGCRRNRCLLPTSACVECQMVWSMRQGWRRHNRSRSSIIKNFNKQRYYLADRSMVKYGRLKLKILERPQEVLMEDIGTLGLWMRSTFISRCCEEHSLGTDRNLRLRRVLPSDGLKPTARISDEVDWSHWIFSLCGEKASKALHNRGTSSKGCGVGHHSL